MDFWSLFRRGKEVLERKLKEPKVGTNDDPPDMKAALRTFDFLMDATKSLAEESIVAVKDNLRNCSREIDKLKWRHDFTSSPHFLFQS